VNVCGLRRIEAFKALGKNEIPARIVNLEDIVKGEISENTLRKDFSWEEIIEIKKAVEPEIRKESETRMLSGKPSAYFAEGTSNNNAIFKNYSENQTRVKVAKYVSLHGKEISHSTVASAEKVYDAVQKEPDTFGQIWRDLNSEKISPHKALKKVQNIQVRQKFLAEKPAIPLPDGIKLFEGDFVEKSLNIADKSVDLIFTDPPYDLKSLPQYQELAKVAERVLKEGGQDHKYQIQQFMESAPGSKFASATDSTTNSLICVVDNETRHLRIGPVVTSNRAILVIDEIGRMPKDEQARLLSAMQEGTINFARFGT
jgi:16S rRNA G966 N2-methylase RsmD